MKRKNWMDAMGRLSGLLAVGLVFFALGACSGRPGAVISSSAQEKRELRRIAVAPFMEMNPENAAGQTAYCPLCGKVFSSEKMAEGTAGNIEKNFTRQLAESGKFELVPVERVQAVYQRVNAASLKGTPLQILRSVGEELSVDGVVAGYVYRFRERRGYPYAAERPASVAFEIHLIRVSDGVSVWRGSFDHTQASLMENVLRVASFYREKGRWVTAEELAEEGMEGILKTFPGLN